MGAHHGPPSRLRRSAGQTSPDNGARQRRVTPYLLAGVGLFQHRDRFFRGSYIHNEGAFTAGGGVRVFVNDRIYVAPEVRLWEMHFRTTIAVGVQLSR